MALRLLVIDDNPNDRELAVRALRQLATPSGPAEVVAAGDWPEARARLDAGGIDLVLLDFNLPGLNGLEVLKELARRPVQPPVVMMTGQNDLATAVQTLRAGARDYVPKAFGWEPALCLTVERVLERVQLEQQLDAFRDQVAGYALELEDKVAARTAMVEAQAKEIERLYLKAEETARLKEEIVANVSHEFRTPLVGVLGFAQLLQENLADTASAEVLAMLGSVRTQGERLLQLVQSLMTLKSLTAGSEVVVSSRFTLASLMQDLRSHAVAMLGDKGLAFDWKLGPEPGEIEHDREKIRGIAYHLLSNAIKFTSTGRIEVSLARTAAGEIVVGVADSGVGLPEAAREAIFEDFRQLDGSASRRYEGLGLGLGIVKRYVALLGGRVRVDSAPGGGTTIVVTLPALASGGEPARQPGCGGSAALPAGGPK